MPNESFESLAALALDDLRAPGPPARSACVALLKHHRIDELRAMVLPGDMENLLALAKTTDDDKVFSFCIHLLQAPILLDNAPHIADSLRTLWGANGTTDRRIPLAFALLDFPGLSPEFQGEMFRYCVENWDSLAREASRWCGGAEGVLQRARDRLGDTRCKSTKRWIYLLSLVASNDQPGVRALAAHHLQGKDKLEREAAQAVMARLDEGH